ncbi:MAG TPA: hypothetical protein VLG50_07850 [Candidatus Saccharimonadales bacterium]|nr:hypothetical protein [Candidatus Saccharimonadales bacterium]
MDNISILKRSDVLKNLKQYKMYNGLSEKKIVEKLGKKDLYSLRTELRRLESKKNQSISILPNDMLFETLILSDINTIVNTCTSNKELMLLCDDTFWINKFKHDNLPITRQPKNFNGWVKLYRWESMIKNRSSVPNDRGHIDLKILYAELDKYGFTYKYKIGIDVYINKRQYVNVSRQPNFELTLSVYTDNKLDPYSLFILEEYGNINFESLIHVLNLVKSNLSLFKL